jgi:hypothetical protein
MRIPDGIPNIASLTFQGCASLTNVTIPESVTSIGDDTFQGCSDLVNISIPDAVTDIGEFAFDSCSNLTSVTIPAKVTSIGNEAFANCSDLGAVYFLGNAPSMGVDVFSNDFNVTIYFLSGTTGWSNLFAGIPAVPWNPSIQTSGAGFGVLGNQFVFTVTGTINSPIVLETCTNLANPVWIPLQTLTLTNGSFSFSEPWKASLPCQYYRIVPP